MNKKLSYAFAMAGLTCVLSLPVMAATSESGSTDTTKGSSMSAPAKDHSTNSKKAPHGNGENGAKTKGTALPGSGGEAGSGGNSGFGNKTSSGSGSSGN